MIGLRPALLALTLLASMLLLFGCDSQTSSTQAPPAAGEAEQAPAIGGSGQVEASEAPAGGALAPGDAAEPSQSSDSAQEAAAPLSGASAGNSDLPELKILQFLPNGQVSKLSQIAVMFNQPMVALGDFKLVDQDQMDLEPPIEGRLRWLNQYTLAFIPEEIYTGSLTVTATLKGGLKSLAGQELKKGASVTVILPAVTARPDYYQQTFNPESPFKPVHKVIFSQPVDLDRLRSLAFFEGDEGNSGEFSVPAVFTEAPSQYEPSEFRATAEPAENLPRNSSYRLVIKPGQFSKLGPRPTDETITILTGRTYGNLEASVKSRQLDDNNQAAPFGGLDFDFTVPVEFGAALAAISSDPPMAEIEELKKAYRAFLTAEKAAPDGAVPGSDEIQKIDPTVASWAAQHNFKVLQTSIPLYPRLLPNSLYTITIKAGLSDALGQELPGDAVYRIRTGAYKPFVEIDESFGGIMEIATDPRVPVNLANVSQVNIQGWALEPADAVRMLFLTDRNYLNRMYLGNQDKQILAQTFNAFSNFALPKSLVLDTRRSLTELPYTELFSLEDLFGPERIGKVLFIRLLESDYPTVSVFQCTDLGLTVKVGRESSLAWVTDMPTGQSVAGAKVEILSRSGEILSSGHTGPDGLVKLPGGLEINDILEKMEANPLKELGEFVGNQLFYIVASFEDETVLWSSQADDSFSLYRYDLAGGSAHPLGPNPDLAFVLSSQPIYRPGSLVRLKLIYRETVGENLKDLPEGPVKVIIHDPFANRVFEEQLQAGPFGTVSLDYQLPPTAALGSHFVYLSKDPEASIPAGDTVWRHPEFVSIGSFEVQTFRSPPFDIEIEEMPKEVISGETLSVKAKAAYHFGAPVSGQSASWSVQDDTAYDFEIPALAGFSVFNSFNFIPKDSDADESYSPPSNVLSQGTLTLDNLGRLDFSLAVEPEAKPRPRKLSVNLSATDVDGRPVSKGAGLLAHPAELYPALKLRNYLAKAGEPQTFDLAAASPDGALKEAEVALTLYKRSWATSRRRNYSVSYIYDSKAYDEVVEEKTIKTGSSLSEVPLTPPSPGFYWLKASLKDSKGRINETSVSFYATGPGSVGWRYDNSDTVTMVADKAKYAPGDVARILVQSPFSQGQALVTVERAFIREERIIELTDQSPVIEVPISAADAPNLFVSIVLNRGRIADQPDGRGVDLGKPAVRLGYVSLLVEGEPDKLLVEVTPDKARYAPGDEVSLDLAVTGSDGRPFGDAEVALAVIDTSLVQVAGDFNYFPESVFSALRPLTVSTSSPVNQLISRQNWDRKGGGGQEAGGGADFLMRESRAAEDIRANFLDLAYFEPSIKLSEDGKAKAAFKLPDNLTTFKIYAAATGHGRFSGTGQNQVLSTKDLLLRSSLPSFASSGDEFSAGVIVTNRLDTPGLAKVEIETQNLELTEASHSREIEIPAGQSVEVLFPAKASLVGEASLRFKVTMGDLEDNLLIRLPVHPANAPTSQASYRQVEEGETVFDLSLIPDFEPAQGGLSVSLAPSLVGVLSEPFSYLESYPYDCLEQTTSKAFGALLKKRLSPRLPKVSDEALAKAQDQVKSQLDLLAASQLSGGGFALWPGQTGWGAAASPYLTAYLLEFMLEAKKAGYEVDSEVVSKSASYLESYLTDPQSLGSQFDSEDARRATVLYALVVLARCGSEVEGFVEAHFRNAPQYGVLDLLYLTRAVGFLPKSASRTERLLELLPLIQNHLELTAGQAQLSLDKSLRRLWFDPDKLTALAALTLSETAPHNVFLESLLRSLVSRSTTGHFSTTQSNVLALLAIANYLDEAETVNPNLTVKAEVGSSSLIDATFKSFVQKPETAFAPLYDLQDGDKVTVSAQGTGKIWSTVKLSQASKTANLDPELSASLVVSRTYTIVKPQPSAPGETKFARGQVVKVDLVLMTPDDRTDLVVEDCLPAGFEPINFNLKSEDQTLVPILSSPKEEEGGAFERDWYSHQQIWPDRVAVFADYLPAGVYNFSYLARPATPGVYRVPGPKAEGMYEPETFGRGKGAVIEITK